MADGENYARGNRGGGRGRGNNNWRANRWRGYRRGRGSTRSDTNDRGSGNFESSENVLLNVETNPVRTNQRINQHFPPVPCPYKGWKHYFPLDDFVPTARTTQKIEWSIEFFSRGQAIDLNATLENEGVPLDYEMIVADEVLQQQWPQFNDDLYSYPANTLAILSIALHQVLVDIAKNDRSNDSTVLDELSYVGKAKTVPYVRVRLTNYKKITQLKNLRAGLFGKLVAVSGTVVRASTSKPLCQALAFRCRTCSGVMSYPQIDGKFESPIRCLLDRDNLQCTGNNFEPVRGSPKNVVVEWQTIRLQENSSDNCEIGRIPRTIDCELMEDLVGGCSPGEVITIIGIVKATNVTDAERGASDKNMYTFYIEAVSLHNRDRGNKQDTEAEPLSETTSSSTGLLTFNMKDYFAIRKIHEEPNLFAFLVASLCPSIYGNHLVKAGLLLGLFGGNSGINEATQSPFSKRSNIHVLIVGDPGLGKSQMLHACSMVSPRGVFVCGNSTTNSGLTVTLTKDGQTNGNEYTLEAGALVLGDQGSCCIDEFDKMSGQYQALLEAMEQQVISITKSGVVCSLPARTSILAAANPVGGHYNRAKTVSENIKLGTPLLSRFDLVFLLLDRPDLNVDVLLTEHIMALHAGNKTTHSTFSSMNQSTSADMEENTLKSRLASYFNEDLLPAPLLRKYIAYAREYVHPVLNEEARKEIHEFYVHLRKSQYTGDSTTITLRQLESLMRLAQARAKAELRETVTGEDARDVIELVKTSFDDVFKNEFGALDFSRSHNGSGMSSRNEGKKFVEFLRSYANKMAKTLFSIEELTSLSEQCGIKKKGSFKEFLETLNHQGYLLKKGGSLYKLIVD